MSSVCCCAHRRKTTTYTAYATNADNNKTQQIYLYYIIYGSRKLALSECSDHKKNTIYNEPPKLHSVSLETIKRSNKMQ